MYIAGVIAWAGVGMVEDITRGRWGLDVLAIMAMIATLAVGEYVAALIVVLMLSGGEALEDYAARRAKQDLSSLLDQYPQVAHVVAAAADGSNSYRDVPVTEVQLGDILLVRPSEIVAVDGELLSASGTFDDSSLTGESLPVSRERGDKVYSGSVNGDLAVEIRTLRSSADSQYQQIVAEGRRRSPARLSSGSPTGSRFPSRWRPSSSPVSHTSCPETWSVSPRSWSWRRRVPLLIAAPVAFLGGMSRTSRAGVIVKGGGVLEQLARTRSAAFDKTGTLTQGNPELVEIRAHNGFDADELLSLAACAEQYSTHVFAEAIVRAATERRVPVRPARDAREEATNGVAARVDGHEVVVGKRAFVESVAGSTDRGPVRAGKATAHVAVDGTYAGMLVLADEIRQEAPTVISWLSSHGVSRIAMLTGDNEGTGQAIAAQAGITEVHAELLPPEKVHLAAELRPRPVLMVGDGVNEPRCSPRRTSASRWARRGPTAAGDAADAVILKDSLARCCRRRPVAGTRCASRSSRSGSGSRSASPHAHRHYRCDPGGGRRAHPGTGRPRHHPQRSALPSRPGALPTSGRTDHFRRWRWLRVRPCRRSMLPPRAICFAHIRPRCRVEKRGAGWFTVRHKVTPLPPRAGSTRDLIATWAFCRWSG